MAFSTVACRTILTRDSTKCKWEKHGLFSCTVLPAPFTPNYLVFSNFAFLQNVARDFTGTYTARKIKNCNAYAMDKQFSPNLRTTMHYYNVNHVMLSRDQKINSLLAKVEDMKTVLGRNLTLLLEREHKLVNLLETSEQAVTESMVFKKKAKKVKQEYRGRSYKLWFLIAGMLILILYTIVTTACGVRFQRCGTQDSNRLRW
jgi:hypothetical protein